MPLELLCLLRHGEVEGTEKSSLAVSDSPNLAVARYAHDQSSRRSLELLWGRSKHLHLTAVSEGVGLVPRIAKSSAGLGSNSGDYLCADSSNRLRPLHCNYG